MFLRYVLHQRTNINRMSFFPIPLLRSTMVGRFCTILGGGQRGVIFRAFLRRSRPPGAPITILREISTLGPRVGHGSVFGHRHFLTIVLVRRSFRFHQRILKWNYFPPTSLVQRLFMVTSNGPIFPYITYSNFRSGVRVFSGFLTRLQFYTFSGLISAAGIVNNFSSVIRPRTFLNSTSNIYFGGGTHLLINRTTTLRIVKIMNRFRLRLVVGSTIDLATLFLFGGVQRDLQYKLTFVTPFKLLNIFKGVPNLTHRGDTKSAAYHAMITGATLENIPGHHCLFCKWVFRLPTLQDFYCRCAALSTGVGQLGSIFACVFTSGNDFSSSPLFSRAAFNTIQRGQYFSHATGDIVLKQGVTQFCRGFW